MTQSVFTVVSRFEVDESRRKNLRDDLDVVRYVRPEHVTEWSFRPTIRVTSGADLSELMDQDFGDDGDENESSSR